MSKLTLMKETINLLRELKIDVDHMRYKELEIQMFRLKPFIEYRLKNM